MRSLLFLPILLSILSISTAWRTFLRGRSKGGNLGEPVLSSETTSLPKEQWFTQYVDHLNPTDTRVWKQRYFVNSDFYKPNGPIFLMIGGHGAINAKWMIEGEWIEYAKEFGAMCFYVEHRFYGKSHPAADLSTDTMLISSEIALADLAYFIKAINSEYKFSNDTKWIAFGGSYAGSLAAWLRMKYPYVVHGAVSNSAPLLAQFDFHEFYTVVINALKEYSDKCVNVIQEANSQITTLLRHAVGQQEIHQKFKLCDPIDGNTKRTDISNLYETLASNLAGIVQYNKDNRQSPTANINIKTVCDILVDEKIGNPVDRYAYISNMILNATKENCLDYGYDKMIHELRNVTWDSEQAEGARQWMYQTCSEFGFLQTSTGQSNVFGNNFPVDFFVQQCSDIFGPEYNENILKSVVGRTNVKYGALNLQVSNVVFVHGSVDPWHVLGITQSSNLQAPAIYIKGAGHCASMYPSSEHDTHDLKEARIQIKRLIGQWLQKSSQCQ